MKRALRSHWPEYLMEAAELGLFMLSASLFAALLELPSSPVRAALPDAFGRRVLMGVAMGATAVAIIKSPLGQQSGAHFNPAVTTTFFRLGKVTGADAVFYVLAQFTGAVLGMLFARLVLGMLLGHPAVGYVATVPGEAGPLVALGAEALISFVLMSVVLLVGSDARLARYTPYFAEPGAHVRVGRSRGRVPELLGLRAGPARGNARGGRGPRTREGCLERALREARPLQRQALHLLRGEWRISVSSNGNGRYDVIIIGSGAGGGTLAYRLAPSGKKVLLIERGPYVPREPQNWSTKAVNVEARYNTKESWLDKDGGPLHPHTNYFVGGNTKFYGAALFRMREEDFGELRHHGGVSPAWPISY